MTPCESLPAFRSTKRANSWHGRFVEVDSAVELVGFGAHAYAMSQSSLTSTGNFDEFRYSDSDRLQEDDGQPDIIRSLMC